MYRCTELVNYILCIIVHVILQIYQILPLRIYGIVAKIMWIAAMTAKNQKIKMP